MKTSTKKTISTLITCFIIAINVLVLYYDVAVLIYYKTGEPPISLYHSMTFIARDPHCTFLIVINAILLAITSVVLLVKKH